MAKFLQSRGTSFEEDEILGQNILSISYLRSLIAGDFFLSEFQNGFLLLHEKGIFVLRQCHQTGMIFGQKEEKQWTDLNYLGHERKFPNPLKENEENIDDLMQILKLPKSSFCNCIVFDAQSELRQVPQDSEAMRIMRADQLEEFFTSLPQATVRYTHTQLGALNDIFMLVSTQR